MQNIASAFFSSKGRQKDWTSSLFSLFRKINEAGLFYYCMVLLVVVLTEGIHSWLNCFTDIDIKINIILG